MTLDKPLQLSHTRILHNQNRGLKGRNWTLAINDYLNGNMILENLFSYPIHSRRKMSRKLEWDDRSICHEHEKDTIVNISDCQYYSYKTTYRRPLHPQHHRLSTLNLQHRPATAVTWEHFQWDETLVRNYFQQKCGSHSLSVQLIRVQVPLSTKIWQLVWKRSAE